MTFCFDSYERKDCSVYRAKNIIFVQSKRKYSVRNDNNIVYTMCTQGEINLESEDPDWIDLTRGQHELNPIFGRVFMWFALKRWGHGRQPLRNLWRMLQGECTLEWHLDVLSMHDFLRCLLEQLDVERLVLVGPCVTTEHVQFFEEWKGLQSLVSLVLRDMRLPSFSLTNNTGVAHLAFIGK